MADGNSMAAPGGNGRRDSSRASASYLFVGTLAAVFLSVFLSRRLVDPLALCIYFVQCYFNVTVLFNLFARIQGFVSTASLLALISQSSVHSS